MADLNQSKKENIRAHTFEGAPFELWEWNATSNLFYFPNTIKSLPGIDPLKEELTFQDWMNGIHPADRELFQQQFDQFIKGGASFFSLEYRVIEADKNIRWIMNEGKVAERDQQGNVVRVLGIFKDISDRKVIDYNLNERLKELNCHNLVSKITGPNGITTHYLAIKVDITDQKKHQEQLQQSEAALNLAQEIADMGSWELDLVTGRVKWSKNFYKMLGLNPDEATADNDYFMSLVHPDDLHLFQLDTEELHSIQGPISLDYRIILANGQIRWFQNNLVPVFEQENMVKLTGVNIDITEKKTAEENLRMHSDRLDAIVKAIPDLILVTDDQGFCLEYYTNQPNESPVPMDRIIGSNVRSIFEAEMADLHLRKIQECLQDKSLKTYDCELNRNGLSSHYETRMVYLDNTSVLAFVRDITDKKIRDKEILKLSLAVEQSPVIVVITDLVGNVEYVNRAFTETTGYKYHEVIGKNTSTLKSGLTDRAVYHDLWQTIETGKEWHTEWINKKKSGDLYWEHISITPIHDESGKITNYLAIKQDISNRKRAEQEILELNASLEQKIEERTGQLAKTNSDLLFEIEERKQIEEELKNKTIELENFFSVALDLLCIADTSGNFIKVNKAWETILGYATKDLENRKFLEFVHPDDIPGTLEVMQNLSEQNPVLSFINRYRTREGKYRFIEWRSVPVGNRVYAAARDITERKQAEEFENEMLLLSPQLTGLTLSEIDAALDLALQRIGKFLNVDRTYIFELNTVKGTLSNTHEWRNEGISPEILNLQEFPVNSIPNWIEALERQETILILSGKLVIPLFSENIPIGFVGLDDIKKERTWSDAEIYILKVWGSMISFCSWERCFSFQAIRAEVFDRLPCQFSHDGHIRFFRW